MMGLTSRGGPNAPAQRGFTIVAAVFLVTLLSLLSAYLIAVRVYQESGITLDMLATRAYAAARSGTEWGAYNSLRNNTCAASTALGFGGSLAGFVTTVACTRSVYDEGGSPINIDMIVANACNQPAAGNCPNPAPGPHYVERQITLTVSP
jgi:MSHA biogenesis protein MshP